MKQRQSETPRRTPPFGLREAGGKVRPSARMMSPAINTYSESRMILMKGLSPTVGVGDSCRSQSELRTNMVCRYRGPIAIHAGKSKKVRSSSPSEFCLDRGIERLHAKTSCSGKIIACRKTPVDVVDYARRLVGSFAVGRRKQRPV